MSEEGEEILDQEEAKNYIADYYEGLYQERESNPEYQEWTNKIKDEIERIEKEMESVEAVEPITTEELNSAIKSLKRKKATGPDEVPNEAFIEADQETREIYREVFNNITSSQVVPDEWQEGELLRMYKGKGKKGKCSNERGITLSSNVGKLYERIMNNRIKKKIKITDYQAGGRQYTATVDHILILKELITYAKNNKKKLHIGFLDVTKAYDKAWLDAIMYIMYKQGLKDNHWTIAKNLNKNLTAKIQTKHGHTRKINMNSIRQGGVLSVLEFGLLMDETSKDIEEEKLGIKLTETSDPIGSLLWVDDLILAEEEDDNFQKELDVSNHVSNKYHSEYGLSKSNVMTICYGRNKDKPQFKLGENILETTSKYKYLGYIQNDKNDMKDHFKAVKGKVEAVYQRIIALAGNTTFKNIEMESIWTNVESKIEPIIT